MPTASLGSDDVVSKAPLHHPVSSLRTLMWAALGVVYGDVGTSPLYAMSETVSSHLAATRGQHEKVTLHFGELYGRSEVLGWTSMFLWAIALVVTLKYVLLIMRADNQGEGGMLSILALLQSKAKFSARGVVLVVGLAVVGSGLILGDGAITPSLSILSAWEGLEVVTHAWSPYIPVLSVLTLIGLFSIQRFGSARVGALFAPFMALWFVALAVMGCINLAKHPDVLWAFDPRFAARYVLAYPRATLFVVGSVDLCITGCEALYADMGHFGRSAVRRVWFWMVWPALMLNYLGQGARLLDSAPVVDGNVFFALVPSSPICVYPLVVLSWGATIIASQALISGAFSLIAQAIQLGLFPRTRVVHTNPNVEGQIYIPAVNWAYLTVCVLLVVAFRSSHNLAPAYGLAVTGTMAFTTILFYLIAVQVWKWRPWLIGPVCLALVVLDLAFFVSNATQFFEGGYVTILMAVVLSFTMLTWRKGRTLLSVKLSKAAVPLEAFLASLQSDDAPMRVKGTAVFMTSNPGAPPALVQCRSQLKTLHQSIVLLKVATAHRPEVSEEERFTDVVDHGQRVYSVTATFGFAETPDIPRALAHMSSLGFDLALEDVSYFLGRESLVVRSHTSMSFLRKMFFGFLSRNAATASAFFRLPPERVIELGTQIEF